MGRAVAALAVLVALLAGTAHADTFTVLGPADSVLPSLTALPSAQVPNAAAEIALPAAFTTAPAAPEQLSYPELLALWQRAGAAYGVPWQVLASINKVESNLGRNMGPSSAGAIGWMQFMPSTWLRWGVDANGDGVADPWTAEDAVYSAARYLAAAGGSSDISRAVYAYNHADWYVREVLDLANAYGQSGEVAFSLDQLDVRLELAQQRVSSISRKLTAKAVDLRRITKLEGSWRVREDRARLFSDQLEAGKQAGILAAHRQTLTIAVDSLRQKLATARTELDHARELSRPASFDPGAAMLLEAPSYSGQYVFPVGGGPSLVSVGHTHHDYPAADIAAPAGSPVYALSDGVVLRSWHYPDPRCGIGLTMRGADGQVWTYCHLSYEEPGIEPGAQLTAGQSVGLVGATGHATGPHLHLQLDPTTSYPQTEAWFQSFAGTAFSWQDAATPDLEPSEGAPIQFDTGGRTLASASVGISANTSAPVFEVVPEQSPTSSPSAGDVVVFSR